jgi:hypothetical protein
MKWKWLLKKHSFTGNLPTASMWAFYFKKLTMKKIIQFFKNLFEKNGLLKLIAAFVILIVSIIVVNYTHSFLFLVIFDIIGLTALTYIIIAFIVYFIAAIINTIRDISKK